MVVGRITLAFRWRSTELLPSHERFGSVETEDRVNTDVHFEVVASIQRNYVQPVREYDRLCLLPTWRSGLGHELVVITLERSVG